MAADEFASRRYATRPNGRSYHAVGSRPAAHPTFAADQAWCAGDSGHMFEAATIRKPLQCRDILTERALPALKFAPCWLSAIERARGRHASSNR